MAKRLGTVNPRYVSQPLPADKLENFYGAGSPLKYDRVRDLTNGGKLATRDVELVPFGGKKP